MEKAMQRQKLRISIPPKVAEAIRRIGMVEDKEMDKVLYELILLGIEYKQLKELKKLLSAS